MIKIVALLVLYFVACYATPLHVFHNEVYQDILDKRQSPPLTCPQNVTSASTCTPIGSSCPANGAYNGENCVTSNGFTNCTQCQVDCTCISGTCQPRVGNTCPPGNGNTCQLGINPAYRTIYVCNAVTGDCINDAGANDACSTNADCGINGTCTNSVCAAIAVGGNCTGTSQCAYGSYCKNGACAAQIAAGGTCVPPTDPTTDSQCATGYCATVAAPPVCVNYLAAIGSPCSLSAGIYACIVGAYCNTTNSICTAVSSNTGSACNTSADCPVNQACACNGNTAQCKTINPGFPANCQTQLASFATCYAGSQCTSYSMSPSSCVMKNCGQQGSCYLTCINNYYGLDATCLSLYPTLNTACIGTGGSGSGTKSGGGDAGTSAASVLQSFLF